MSTKSWPVQFSMAVLAAMVSIALDMVIRVSAAFWSTALVNKFLLDGAFR